MHSPQTANVILFLGRLKRDKGVLGLVEAFDVLSRSHEDIWLWIVGPDEDGLEDAIRSLCPHAAGRLRLYGYTRHAEHYMAAADVFFLPSYRESFGLAILEAAACAVPAVASRIYGITDAVDDDRTGILFSYGDIADLQLSLKRILLDDAWREELGKAAYERATSEFSSERIVGLWLDFYSSLLSSGATH